MEYAILFLPLFGSILGYLGRLMRAKAVYEKELTLSNEEDALKNTKRIMDNAYFTWFFLS